MRKSGSVVLVIILLFISLCLLAGCGGNATNTTPYPTPVKVSLTPTADVSLELGKYATFTGTPQNATGGTLTEPVEYRSSNTAVVTVSSTGLACAGTWDSTSNPQVCTPGGVGTAQITAVAQGISSRPVNIYVHQHIDRIQVEMVPGQTLPASYSGPSQCFSLGHTFNLQSKAYSGTVDITPTVGINFTWQAVNSSVMTLSTTASGLLNWQAQATAALPGVTSIFASIGGTTSLPVSFETCRVESISLAFNGESGHPIAVPQSTTGTIVPTIIDSSDTTITGSFLSWNSSDPTVVGVTSTGTISTPVSGGAAVIASCTPPTCNAGFSPSLPIYPESVLDLTVTGTSAGPPAGAVWVSSTGKNAEKVNPSDPSHPIIVDCGSTDDCVSNLISISTPANTLGSPISLPAIPNSLAITPTGSKMFLGTDSGLLGTKGLILVNTTASPITAVQSTSVSGKVLATSPDGNKVVVSNTTDIPNQVFIVSVNSGGISDSTAYPITGATAASFSPDGLKAYVVATNPDTLISTLYIFSALDAPRTVTLSSPANEVSFLSLGAFAYLAGGSPSSPRITAWTNCTGVLADTIPMPSVPSFFRTLPNSAQMLAVASPGIELFDINTTPTGCSPTVSHGLVTSYNLGQGSFTAKQLLISSDSKRAYILTTNLANILVFDISTKSSSAFALAGNANPLQAALISSGQFLYVIASDGKVHVLDTVSGNDLQQVSFPDGLCSPSTVYTCKPDLIVAKPGS